MPRETRGYSQGPLREALRAGEIDFAVHSLKDLPVDPAPGTRIAAYLPRAVTHDTLIGPMPLELCPKVLSSEHQVGAVPIR